MKHRISSFAFLLASAITFSSALSAEQPSQKCDVGPINKTYGKTPWLVYSCNNKKAEGNAMVVLVSAPGSPAMPFVFFFYIKDGGYHLYGEGTGNKEATDAALSELQKLSEPEITKLIVQTQQVQTQAEKSGGK
jgi:hypothetical protein